MKFICKTISLTIIFLYSPLMLAYEADLGAANLAYERGEYDKAFLIYKELVSTKDMNAYNALGLMYCKGLGVSKDIEEGNRWLKAAAEAGLPKAQTNLGINYINGSCGNRDYEKAVYWFKKAAKQGNKLAQYNLGFAYASGLGVLRNQDKAANWYRKASKQGMPEAQSNLGLLLAKGIGIKQDIDEAIHWLEKAAEQDHITAYVYLGEIYFHAWGVDRDCNKALYWYEKAANEGDAEAQNYAAGVYNIPACGLLDREKSFKWMEMSAKQDYPQAMHNLGIKYYKGDGVDKDVEIAKLWLSKAADKGYRSSMSALEEIRLPAIATQNCVKSNRELLKEAKNGNRIAQRVIGLRYSVSKWSLSSSQRCASGLDYGKAFYWLSQAAKQGDRYAQNAIGNFYKYGRGDVKRNDIKAYAWLKLAAQHGLMNACVSVNYLQKKMEPEDVEKAKRLNLKYLEEYNDEDVRTRIMGNRIDVCGCCSAY